MPLPDTIRRGTTHWIAPTLTLAPWTLVHYMDTCFQKKWFRNHTSDTHLSQASAHAQKDHAQHSSSRKSWRSFGWWLKHDSFSAKFWGCNLNFHMQSPNATVWDKLVKDEHWRISIGTIWTFTDAKRKYLWATQIFCQATASGADKNLWELFRWCQKLTNYFCVCRNRAALWLAKEKKQMWFSFSAALNHCPWASGTARGLRGIPLWFQNCTDMPGTEADILVHFTLPWQSSACVSRHDRSDMTLAIQPHALVQSCKFSCSLWSSYCHIRVSIFGSFHLLLVRDALLCPVMFFGGFWIPATGRAVALSGVHFLVWFAKVLDKGYKGHELIFLFHCAGVSMTSRVLVWSPKWPNFNCETYPQTCTSLTRTWKEGTCVQSVKDRFKSLQLWLWMRICPHSELACRLPFWRCFVRKCSQFSQKGMASGGGPEGSGTWETFLCLKVRVYIAHNRLPPKMHRHFVAWKVRTQNGDCKVKHGGV